MPCKPLVKAGPAKSARVFALACLSLAAPAYAQEAGLEGRDDVLLQSDFERADWYEDWGYANLPGPERQNHLELTNDDCFDGEQCLRVHLPRGDHYGASFEYAFRDHGGEPLEMYYRYAVRFGPTWNAVGNGKLPGLVGTYGRAGYGGRTSNGRNGWSARGIFHPLPRSEREFPGSEGYVRIGNYTYHVDQEGQYGDRIVWDVMRPGNVVGRSEWVQVEGYVRLNTPGENDGVLRGWIDGELAYDRTDFRFRDTDDLRIERFWFNIYYGGSWVPPEDMYVDFDNVVIASSRVGAFSSAPPVVTDAGVTPDAGMADAGVVADAGADDGGAVDAGVEDAGSDAAAMDTGTIDAGGPPVPPDAGAPLPDAGEPAADAFTRPPTSPAEGGETLEGSCAAHDAGSMWFLGFGLLLMRRRSRG
ncbi:MAG: polysaccharide lyase [Myxococcota bacterium]